MVSGAHGVISTKSSDAGVVALFVSLPNSCRCVAAPSTDSTQIHKRAKHITVDFKVTVHIDHSEYASGSERYVLVTLKNENKENMK